MDQLKEIIRTIEHTALVVVVVVAALYIRLYNQEKQTRELEKAAQTLPADVIAKYTLENRRLIQLVRDMDGKVKAISRYIPAEGKVEIVAKKQEEALKKLGELMDSLSKAKTPAEQEAIKKEIEKQKGEIVTPETKVTDWGLTSRFGAGIIISPGNTLHLRTGDNVSLDVPISPAIDWKFFYWRRYSALAHLNLFYGGAAVTRHVDDITPRWLHADNIEIGVSAGPLYKGGGVGWGFNLRSNF